MLDFKIWPTYPQSGRGWNKTLNELEASVIVCTWNRAGELKGALETLLKQDIPRDRYEIIVVDNGSTDGTPSLLRELNAAGAGLVLMREDRLGVAYARNTGWRAARSGTIVYFDDDCRADPGWLRTLVGCLQGQPANVACVGGPVRPEWLAPRPWWLSPPLLSYLGLQDLGPIPIDIVPGQWLCSNNLAVRRSALEAVDGFRTDLGRRGALLVDGAETELEERWMARGFACRYDPAPAVRHLVPPTRTSAIWFLKRSFWGGASLRWADGKLDPENAEGDAAGGGARAPRQRYLSTLACNAARVAGYRYAAFRSNPFLSSSKV